MSKRSRDASCSSLAAGEDGRELLECLSLRTKYSQTDSDAPTSYPTAMMQCSLPPHKKSLSFESQEEYEIHYAKAHTNRCATCSKNFPTPCYLGLHIEENHNALREVLAARGEKTYGCFVEGCDRKCSTPQKRRLHLIDKHMFPRTYNFRIVDQGTDKASSMLSEGRRRRVSTTNDSQLAGSHRRRTSSQLQAQCADGGVGRTQAKSNTNVGERRARKVAPDSLIALPQSSSADAVTKGAIADLDSLADSLSALRFVPTSVRLKQKHRPAEGDDERQEC